MKTIYLLLLCTFYCVFTSCDKFLGVAPSKSKNIEISTAAHIDALFAGATMMTNNKTMALSTDLTEVPVDLYKAAEGKRFFFEDMMYYLWTIDAISNYTTPYTWDILYEHIFRANSALENLPKVSGAEELKTALRAEAYFTRACINWELLQTYCLPYCAENSKEMGIPHKTSTSFEQDLTRMTIEDSYKFVEEDLKEALKSNVTNTDRRWRVSLPAVQAFMARFYLNKSNYSEALKYAELALGANSQLVDYNTEMSNKPQSTAYGDIQMIYLWDATLEDASIQLNWKESYYNISLKLGNIWYYPSQSLMDIYDKTNDLRYEYHFTENFSWNWGIKYPYPGYIYFRNSLPYGPSVPEMILTKAECQARQGNYAEAMNTINVLRDKRMRPGEHVRLTATSKDDAIFKVLAERTRELTYTSRWSDIRRFNNNDTPIDDVLLKRTFFPHNNVAVNMTGTPIEYKLSLKDRRFACPIQTSEIVLSRGQLKQNTY